MTSAPKKRGLGRGLNALFEDEEVFAGVGAALSGAPAEQGASTGLAAPAASKSRQTVGIEMLGQSLIQPRKLFEQDSLNELAKSIKVHGLLQPILVRPLKDEAGRYEIIAGERRWRAAQIAQLHEVPIIIRELSDAHALEIALIENLQREDLNPVDEAMGYERLMKEYNYTQEHLGEALGKSRSHVANMVRLLALPDIVLAHLERGDLSAGHARALITAKNPESLAKQVIAKGLNVRQTEALAAEAADRPAPKSAANAKPAKDVDTIALEKDISNQLGMRVSIDSRDGKKGKVSIEFKSLDQLDGLLKRLTQ